jgi:hypothetical protein
LDVGMAHKIYLWCIRSLTRRNLCSTIISKSESCARRNPRSERAQSFSAHEFLAMPARAEGADISAHAKAAELATSAGENHDRGHSRGGV